MNPQDLPEHYRLALQKWVGADAAARQAEAWLSSVEAELFNQSNETAADKKKMWARAHEKYREAALDAVRARTDANAARAEADALKMRWETWRTIESTKRAEMGLR